MKFLRGFLMMLIILTFGCTDNAKTYISYLNGYWEIERVIMNDGSIREYKINQTIDYIYLEENSLEGFRKKLQPNFQGTYSGSKDTDPFKLTVKNDHLKITYTTGINTWTETIIFADSNKLIMTNDAGVTYEYKRYQPISID